jgi:hypothetical protein
MIIIGYLALQRILFEKDFILSSQSTALSTYKIIQFFRHSLQYSRSKVELESCGLRRKTQFSKY